DMSAAVAEAARVLVPGGRLCLAIVHPVQSAGKFVSADEDAAFVIDGSYLDAHRTAETLERDGISMTFHSMHPPLERYARGLEAAGFLIERMREHKTTPAQTLTARWTRVPLFLHVRAVKPA